MADEAKFHCPIDPTSQALVVGCAVGHCPEEELSPFC